MTYDVFDDVILIAFYDYVEPSRIHTLGIIPSKTPEYIHDNGNFPLLFSS